MTTADRARPASPPASRLLSWLIGCVVVAWLVIYNVMRLGGSSPSEAAVPSLAAGAVVGALVFGLGYLVTRRLAASGRVVRPAPGGIPAPAQMDDAQRPAVNLAWLPLGALAAAALFVGCYLAGDWLSSDSADRAKTTIILAAWNVLVGLWLGDEALRLRRGEPDGIESIVLGCTLTAVLAGVGISRELAEAGQIALIVLAAAAGGLIGLAVWRLQGARGVPIGAVGVVIIAALSLILPLTL